MTELDSVERNIPCGCCGDLLRPKFGRRQFMYAAATGGVALALAPYLALAAEGEYEAMVWPASILACRNQCTHIRSSRN